MSAPQASTGIARRIATFVVVGAVIMAVSLTLDRATWHFVRWQDTGREDWGRLLRVMGYLPTWLIAAFAFALVDRRRLRGAERPLWWPARGLYLAASAAGGGLLAEILKLLIRRERPSGDGAYHFRALWEHPLSTSGLGLPSSHVMLAFGAAFAMSRIIPEARGVWYALAAGCALTRLLQGDHYLSDVALGAVGAWAVARALWPVFAPAIRGNGAPAPWDGAS